MVEPIHRYLSRAGLLLTIAAIAGCPDLPRSGDPDAADAAEGDGDGFVPLTIERVVPSAGEPEGGDRVSIFGTGFTPGAAVFFDDAPGNTVLALDEVQLNVNVPPHAAGLVDVRVELPDGQFAVIERAYLYRGPLRIDSIEPELGSVLGGVEATIRGAGFDDSVQILVGGRLLEAPERVDDTTLVGRVPARPQGRDGYVNVIASNGFEQRTLVRGYRYVDMLDVTWLTPPSGPYEGGTVVTLHGAGLTPETIVSVGDVPAEIVIAGRGSTLTFRTPPGAHGLTDIALLNPVQTMVLHDAFHYADPAELPAGIVLAGAWPHLGDAGSQVALTVYGLPANAPAKGLSVTFDDVAATVIDVRAYQNLVVVTVPEGDPGPASIEVNRSGDKASRADLFSYEANLAVLEANPTAGAPAGGTQVRLLGTGFDADAVVLFGGTPAASVEVVNEGRLNAVAPAGVPGRVDVRVSIGSQSATLGSGYEYQTGEAPVLLAVDPPDGSQAGGRLLRLHGTGFAGVAPAVDLGPNRADEVRQTDDATLFVRAPRGDVGSVNVSTDEFGLLAMAYAYFDPTAGYGGTHGGPIPEALNVTVLDLADRDPVAEAFVILWDDLGTPHQGLTDDRGQITFSADRFGPPQMVTAAKDNYTTASVVDFDARNVTLMLIPLISEPSPPGEGEPRGPQLLPDGTVAGNVTGLDKYIVPPPGDCDAKPEGEPGTLCQPCVTDEDCIDPGARCIELAEQGKRCTTACEVPGDCPAGYACVGVGFGLVQCVPAPGNRTAWCGTTSPGIFEAESLEQPGGFTNGLSDFQFDTPPGEHAVVCLGGYRDPDTKEFVPTMMGVRRHVFAMPDELVARQNVELDIPLTRTLKVRLDDAPVGAGEANRHQVEVFIDLNSDGVFHMRWARGFGEDVNDFELPGFPVKFEESLYDASYIILAAAYDEQTELGLSDDGLYVLLDDITQLDDDTVFEVLPLGAKHTRSGIVSEVHAMAGWGNERVWAAAEAGRVLHFDGTWWALQKAPTDATLRGIWAANDSYAWAVGDGGGVFSWDGLAWRKVSMPRSLGGARWWGVFGVGSSVWLVGEAGVWRHDGSDVEPIITPTGKRSPVFRAAWAERPDEVYLVGDGGVIRRWTPAGVENLDLPGGDFHAISGSRSDDVWVVGERGRIAHWDGTSWFEFLPVTRRHLRAVHAVDGDKVWAAGDAGAILAWDGIAWVVHTEVEHADLKGIHVAGDGRIWSAGLHTVIVQPFLRPPRAVNPNSLGDLLDPSRIVWEADGVDASFTYMTFDEQSGFPFWEFMVKGGRHEVPLPDLEAAWGLQALWPGGNQISLFRVYMPGFDIDRFDRTMLNQYDWQAWTIGTLLMNTP